MAGKAFQNLSKLYLSDTFRAWFDKTNEIIYTINDLQIYGVTGGGYTFTGLGNGITISIGTDGIASIGIDLPKSLTGTYTFVNGITFGGFANFTGLTLNLNPTGSGAGATMYGRVVRSVNGMTGDVTFNTLSTPSSSMSGDILVYNATGSTYAPYNLFSGGTAQAGFFHIGANGGLFAGVTSGGASAASFLSKGQMQLIGATSSGIYLTKNGTSLSVSQTTGADISYGNDGGSNVFTINGRNISGTKHGVPAFVLDFDHYTASLGGGGTGNASLNIYDNKKSSIPFQFTDYTGITFNLHFLDANEASGRTSGGATGLALFGGNPASKGLKEQSRIRLENTNASFEVELVGTGFTTAFAVYGQNSGGPYGTLLTPTLVARRDGTVVIGGIGINDGGITGTTHGALNIPSGKLYIGGTMGSSVSSGYQVLTSNGSTASWKTLESTSFVYDGEISSLVSGVIQNGVSNFVFVSSNPIDWANSEINFLDSTNQNMNGPFSATFNFPIVCVVGSPSNNTIGVVGVRMILDGVSTDKYISWKNLYYNGSGVGKYVSPSFTFSGNATSSVSFIPFMTFGSGLNSIEEGFLYIGKGSYLVNFHKLG